MLITTARPASKTRSPTTTRSGPVEPAPAPHEPAALVLEALRRPPCRPSRRWPPRGSAGPPGPSRAARWPSPAMPGTRRASASRSAARIIILEGMHPQYGHSPPTSSASMPTTSSPASASRPATSSPPGPMPTTITSACSAHLCSCSCPDASATTTRHVSDVPQWRCRLRRGAAAGPASDRPRATSKQAMAPAVATLREERVPCWGIDASASHRFLVSAASPVSSEPRTRATGWSPSGSS